MSEKKNVKKRQVVTTHPSSLKHSNSNLAEPKSLWSKLTGNWHLTLAILLSVGWVSFIAYFTNKNAIDIASFSLIELSTMLSGVVLPMVVVWLICLVLTRINPASENQRLLESSLDQLLTPVDIAQDRVVKIIEHLKSEIDNIDAAADVASKRFKNLENNFQEQISELFKATLDADQKTNEMKNKLSEERDAIKILANDIEKHTDKITKQFEKFKEDTQAAGDATLKHSEKLNSEMNVQNETLDSHSKQIEESLGNIALRLGKITEDISDQSSHSYHNLSEIVDGFDERKAVLNNFMTTMMEEVTSICEKLDQQTSTVSQLTSQSSHDSEILTSTIKMQAEELSTIAEKVKSDIKTSGSAIEEQAKSMGLSISEATEHGKINIAKASDFFAEKANDLNRVSSGLETNIKQNFDEITDIITDKSHSLGEDITIQFQAIESEIDRANASIEEMLSTNIEGVSSLVSQNKLDTQSVLSEILSSIESHSEQIEKSLADTRINMIDRTTIIQDEHQSLEKYADSFQHKMIDTEKAIRKQHNNMLACVTIIEDGLGVAIEKIKRNSTSLGTHGQKVIESILSQTNELTNQIAEIQNRSKNSIVEIQNACLQANDNILSKDTETNEVIGKWLEVAGDINDKHSDSMQKIEMLVSKLSSLEKASDKTISTSEENIKRISNELLHSTDRVHLASNSAVEAVEETNRALDKNSEKYQQMINAIQLSSQSLAQNANAMEDKLKKINTDDFSTVAAGIMEQLHSISIDINQYLEGEIPKDLWDNYISGDKSVFIRKIKKFIGKKTISAISEHYKTQTEFRHNSDSYIQTFEGLLETLEYSKQSVYRETLVSSDVGKVYFALAEATGRLKS